MVNILKLVFPGLTRHASLALVSKRRQSSAFISRGFLLLCDLPVTGLPVTDLPVTGLPVRTPCGGVTARVGF